MSPGVSGTWDCVNALILTPPCCPLVCRTSPYCLLQQTPAPRTYLPVSTQCWAFHKAPSTSNYRPFIRFTDELDSGASSLCSGFQCMCCPVSTFYYVTSMWFGLNSLRQLLLLDQWTGGGGWRQHVSCHLFPFLDNPLWSLFTLQGVWLLVTTLCSLTRLLYCHV